MIVPLTYFVSLPERTMCRGSMETGASIAASGEKAGSYIVSIAKVVTKGGDVVGFVYLTDDGFGHHRAEYVQANQDMAARDLSALGLQNPGNPFSSVAKLSESLPTDLKVEKCADAPSSH